jgi:signal transduction histidine kinase
MGKPNFLKVHGAMSTRIQNYDWSKTSLGPIHFWPNSLKNQVFMMLHHPFPMVLFWGRDLIILYNDAFITLFQNEGYWYSSLGHKVLEYSKPWISMIPLIHKVFQSGESVLFQNQLFPENREDEESIDGYYTYSFSPVINDHEEIEGVLMTSFETSKNSKALKKIQDQKQKMNLALEASDIGFFEILVTAQNQLKFEVSESFKKILGLPDPYTLEDINKVFHPDDIFIRKFALFQALRTGVLSYSSRILVNSEIRWIRVKGKINFTDQEKPARILGIVENITGIKVKDEEITLSHKRLEDSLEEQRKLQIQKDEFLQVASHELRSPLTAIKGYGQLVEEIMNEKGMEVEYGMVKKLNERINHIHSLVNSLMDVSKISSNQFTFSESIFDLVSLLKARVEDLKFVPYKHSIKEEYFYNARVKADPDRISQVVSNLFSNALKYSPPGSEIRIQTYKYQRFIAISIIDQGFGISQEDLDKIFDQFFRSTNPDSPLIQGLGLGLYLSSEIIKNQGGRIWAESALGEGSKFTFILPVFSS